MPSNSRDWLRSITIASPVLLATVVSLVFVTTSIISPVEAVNPGASNQGDGQGQGNGQGNGQNTLFITAQELYENYTVYVNRGDNISYYPYNERNLSVSGILTSWNNSGEAYLTLGTDFGGEKVKFFFNYDFTDPTIMDGFVNSPITVFGTFKEMIDGVIILRDAYSHDFDIDDPSTVG